MRFFIICGSCPDWEKTSLGRPDGKCLRLNEARNCVRELCEEEWTKEVERLSTYLGKGKTFAKRIAENQRHLNPRLAIEAELRTRKWPTKSKAKKAAKK